MIETSKHSAEAPAPPVTPADPGEAARFAQPPTAAQFITPAPPPPFVGAPAPLPATLITTQLPVAAKAVRPRGALRIPIRIRLALWYSLLLAFVLALFSFLVYNMLTYNLEQALDN